MLLLSKLNYRGDWCLLRAKFTNDWNFLCVSLGVVMAMVTSNFGPMGLRSAPRQINSLPSVLRDVRNARTGQSDIATVMLSVCLTVITMRYRGHIGWVSSNVVTRMISLVYLRSSLPRDRLHKIFLEKAQARR